MNGRGPRGIDELLVELGRTGERGYSIDDEAVRAGVYCFGAPVFDAAGEPVAGIGVCLNKTTLGADAGASTATPCCAPRTLTQRFGGRAPAATQD